MIRLSNLLLTIINLYAGCAYATFSIITVGSDKKWEANTNRLIEFLAALSPEDKKAIEYKCRPPKRRPPHEHTEYVTHVTLPCSAIAINNEAQVAGGQKSATLTSNKLRIILKQTQVFGQLENTQIFIHPYETKQFTDHLGRLECTSDKDRSECTPDNYLIMEMQIQMCDRCLKFGDECLKWRERNA